MRPSLTPTERLHPSGQSSGQAVVTWRSASTARGSAMARVYHCAGMATPRVVIIGGGFGGLFGARVFRHAAVEVTLVDRHNHHVFQPLLYQVATAGLSPGDIASPIRWILRRQKNIDVLLETVDAIDTSRKQLHSRDGASYSYDYLIVAAGATHAYFG